MSALARLQSLLLSASSEPLSRAWAVDTSIDTHVRELERYLRNGTSSFVPRDIREEAVRRFWTTKRIDNLKDGRLVSYSIALPIGPNRLRIIEDPERFQTLLNYVDQFLGEPKKFRRCFQGLLCEYFSYDPEAPATPTAGRHNWNLLRTYLREHIGKITVAGPNPDWTDALQQHNTLLTDDPCTRYGGPLLSGNSKDIEDLREILNISDSSWFMRKLYLAQIRAAVSLPDAPFVQLLDRTLQLVRENEIIRDEGLTLLLNRYATSRSHSLAIQLRDSAVDAWGNPWLESRAMHWTRVSPEARAMVSEWLKLEFIEAFFTLLAEEHTGDNRRLAFWARYVNAIEDIHFALGADARNNRSPDFKTLRTKMDGLLVTLHDPVRSNNAFIMRMGPLIVVEFSGYSNACYGYDVSEGLPFELDQPVVLPIDATNSLKRSSRSLWLRHYDGIHGSDPWEERFESELRQGYNILPKSSASTQPITSKTSSLSAKAGTSKQHTPRPPSNSGTPTQSSSTRDRADEMAMWKTTKFSQEVLAKFCREFDLTMEDLRPPPHGGNLWVRTDDSNRGINQVLAKWGFSYKSARKGWWWKWS